MYCLIICGYIADDFNGGVLLDCIILHINGKQFRCIVLTFVQYITYTGITDEFFNQPLHNINKLGQFMSILPSVILPR